MEAAYIMRRSATAVKFAGVLAARLQGQKVLRIPLVKETVRKYA
jgi:hypothetical protein